MWQKYVTRRLAVQIAEAWNFGWGEAMKKVYGLSVTDTLVFKDSQKTDYYVDREEHERYVAGLYALLEKPEFLKTFHREARETLEKILAETVAKFAGGFEGVSHKALLALYRDFVLPNQAQFYVRMWAVFNVGEPLANVVERHIRRSVPEAGDEEVSKYLLTLSTPLEPNDVLNERRDLLQLATLRPQLSEKELSHRLAEHAARYRHIPMFDFDHEPYTEKYFRGTLDSISDLKTELKELEKRLSKRAQEYEEALRALEPNAEFSALAEFLKENVFLRDYRDMLRQKLNLELRPFYGAVGSTLGLSVEETAMLTDEEILEHLSHGAQFPETEAHKRQEAYLLIQRGNAVEIYSGDEALRRAENEPGIFAPKMSGTMLVGVIGSRGKAQGPAKIVFTNKDLGKIEPGDILITTMTRQDFVSAVRKAAALVTDEGSVTAHAAIIAREFGIPCVVATKHATEMFKDGDLVEVDAERGVVRVVSRASL